MKSLMVVVLEVATQLLTELTHGLKLPAVHEIRFERVEERLDVGILAGRAPTGHALANARGRPPPPGLRRPSTDSVSPP